MPTPGPGDTGPQSDLLEVAAEQLLAVPIDQRPAVLERLVAEHARHAALLRALAEDLAGAERLLDQGFAATSDTPPELREIGPYRVLRTIGDGAFGIVHLCTQETPVRREVAVKVLRPGAGDRLTLARFESERHLLAALRHATIAQVFDAGALPDGRPWFVMEYVPGQPISTYCDRAGLDVDRRLDLFVRVCHGVHHAHEHGIVHRDLKPANVLVFEQDGKPQPRIIDFGIAKALHARHRTAEFRTETGRVVGTPGYMSPEQASGNSGEVDARADVFSLGVMLYELLTGSLPWGPRVDTSTSEPPRPSARIATDAAGHLARQRSTSARKLAARLRGDLDWIVLRALAPEREQRYGSALEFAQDIERHRLGRPVLAGPPSLRYRLRKLARRHRRTILASTAMAAIAAVGLWASLGYRAEARNQTAELEATAADLLARANDQRIVTAPRSEPLRRAIVEDALRLYDRFMVERPDAPELREGRARGLWTLSQVHWLVGEYARSGTVAAEAVAEAEALLASKPDDPTYRGLLGNALRNVGRAASSSGDLQTARTAFDRAVRELELCHAVAPSRYDRLLVAALMEWSSARTASELDQAIEALDRAATIQEAILQAQPSPVAVADLLDVLGALIQIQVACGETGKAGDTYRRAEQLLDSRPPPEPAHAARILGAGAILAGHLGDYHVAVERSEAAIAAAERWCEQEPTWPQPWNDLFDLRGRLMLVLQIVGDERAAIEASRAAIATGETRVTKFPEDHLARGQLADLLSSFAMALLASGHRDPLVEAEDCGRRATVLLESIPESVDAHMRERAQWLFLSRVGFVLDAAGSADAGEHWMATGRAMSAWRSNYGLTSDDAPQFAAAEVRLARHHLDADQDDRASETLDSVDALIRDHPEASDGLAPRAVEVARLRALLAARRGDLAAAAEASERACQLDPGWRGANSGAEGMHAAWRAAQAARTLDPTSVATLRDRAITLHNTAIDSLRTAATGSPNDPWIALPLAKSQIRLAQLLADRGEPVTDLLDAALPVLTALRDDVHADCWDEPLYRAALTLAAR